MSTANDGVSTEGERNGQRWRGENEREAEGQADGGGGGWSRSTNIATNLSINRYGPSVEG